MADEQKDRSDELEGKLDTLQEHIEDAEKKAVARKEDAGDGDVVGDFEEEGATTGADPEAAVEEN